MSVKYERGIPINPIIQFVPKCENCINGYVIKDDWLNSQVVRIINSAVDKENIDGMPHPNEIALFVYTLNTTVRDRTKHEEVMVKLISDPTTNMLSYLCETLFGCDWPTLTKEQVVDKAVIEDMKFSPYGQAVWETWYNFWMHDIGCVCVGDRAAC